MNYKRLGSINNPNFERQSSLVERTTEAASRFPAGTSIGISFKEERVFFNKKDRFNHTHLIGSTGTGKSKFLEHMIRQDLLNKDAGLCLIDPHGSLYEEILLYASHKYPHLAKRVILFNPAEETENILGFNPVPSLNDNVDYILEMLIAACLKVWGQDSLDKTPRITRWLENIFYALMANEMTLVEAAPLISTTKYSKSFREKFYSNVDNGTILEDWLHYEDSPLREKQNIMEGAGNRLRKFLRNEIIRNIIGIKTKNLDLSHVMEEGKILLVNLNGKERISHENAKLLGVMLVNEIFRVAKLRDSRNPKLKPFYCYIDEFGQFVTRDIARALEECRKFRLFMILAHQHLAQLKKEDEYLYASVMTNCKNKVVFGGLSVEDAEVMSEEISTGFLNLKSIKDEMYTTKVRHFEETRRVLGKSYGRNTGKNWSETHGTNESRGTTQGHTRGYSESMTNSEGTTETAGQAQSHGSGITKAQGRGESWTESESEGTSESRGKTRGYSDAVSETEGHTQGNSESSTRGYSNTEGHGKSQTKNSSTTNSRNKTETISRGNGQSIHYNTDGWLPEKNGKNETTNTSRSLARGEGLSQTEGSSESQSQNFSSTESSSQMNGRNESWSQSRGKTHTDSWGESESAGTNWQTGRSHGTNQSSSEAHSQNESHSTMESRARSLSHAMTHGENYADSETNSMSSGTSQSQTQGGSEGESFTESESIVPFLRPEEYQELSKREFWSKDELHYMEMAAMKNQETGEAFIKVGTNAPVRAKIDFVAPVFFSPRTSSKRIIDFKDQVFLHHASVYTPAFEVNKVFEERQIAFFGMPLRFNEKPELEEDAQDKKMQADDFFND